MTRLPPITARELVSFLKKQGFYEDRQRGSHLTLRRDNPRRSVTIPMHSGDLGCGLAKGLLEDAGFSVDDYLRLR